MIHMKLIVNTFAIAASLAVSSISSLAHAAPVTCVPGAIYTDSNSGIAIGIQCTNSATTYYAYSTLSGCSVGADTVKAFLSLAQAALLSGKSLSFVPTTCAANGAQVFTTLVLTR